MSIILTGTTIAEYGNPERRETLAGATLVFYAADKAAARTRWGFYPISDGSTPGREIGRALVAADGSYEVRLSATADVVLAAIEVSRFTYAPDTGKKAFGLLGPVRPVLRNTDSKSEIPVATFNVTMAPDAYSALLGLLDLWLVAGRVVASASTAGVQGVQVTAFDRDITQDDTLGNAPTDGTGSFEIFFPGDQFRQVPALPPPFNTIGLVELIGGPDLFFRVDAGAVALLNESASMGRTAGRENVPNVSFTVLSVQVGTGPTPESGVTFWDAVGNIPLTAIDGYGLTTSGMKAFFGSIDLKGDVYRKSLNGEAIRYRFLVQEMSAATSSGTPAMPPAPPSGSVDADPPPPAGWQAVTTAINPAPYAAIVTTVFTGTSYSITSEPLLPEATANGWITVDQRALAANQQYSPKNLLIQLDTSKLVPPVVATAAVPRKFALVLEVQTASQSFHQSPVIVLQVCNNPVYGKIAIPQQTTGCSPITETSAGTIDISARFEVSHPYLASYQVVVQRWDGVNQASMASESNTTQSSPRFWSGPTSQPVTVTKNGYVVEPCSYEVRLYASARLTNGVTDYSGIQPNAAFCVR